MLRLRSITKSFPFIFDPVLKQMSLDIRKGDFCILLGSNGSGKTTLFKTILGEYKVDSGDIFLNNQNITNLPTYKRAGFISSVAQDVTKGTIQEMSVLENLVLSQMRGKKASYQSYKHFLPLLKEKIASLGLGLERYIDKPLSTLSGGQRQLIATVMATLSHPLLLLLDEHCSALDPKTQDILMSYTNEIITKHHMTAMMITHNLRDALKYGNRLIMLSQGKIVVDMNAIQKQSLSIQDLLDMFQMYEKTILLQEEGHHV